MPLPAGQLPPEEGETARLWFFISKAISAGEKWIQDDTRDWLNENAPVQVCRSYPTHPRWMIGKAADTLRGSLHNEGIVSEVHMLVRLRAGMSMYPDWVIAKLSLKQIQADTAFQLTKMSRDALARHGKTAMNDFAQRSPGQFLKFIGSTFVPKQIEQNVTVTPGQTMEPEQLDLVISSLGEELKRREEEAKLAALHPMDYEPVDPKLELLKTADKFRQATGDPARETAARKLTREAAYKLNKVIDLEADEIEVETGEFQWD